MNNQELLKYMQDNNIIDMAYVQEQIEMKKRKDILDKHPYRVWLAKDGYWKTYLPKVDGTKRLVKKKKQSDLENCIIEFYQSNSIDYSFKVRFEDWIERQQKCGRSDNTIYKYQCDYRRFIEGDVLESMKIDEITEIELSEYLTRLLDSDTVVYWRALKDLFGYINGVFKKAMRDRIITENPCDYVDLPLFRCKCTPDREKTAEERTLSGNERKALLYKINDSSNVASMAVELSLYTGMRVGELAALKWEDINLEHRTIRICRSEKNSRLKKERYISSTKNDKIRVIPLTDDMARVLRKVKEFEFKNGWLGEYVFQDDRGRVYASRISDCAVNNTTTAEFHNKKSIHAIRRTLNSNMKCAGVSGTVAASLLGHTEKVNEENYTYDVSSMEEKSKFMECAGRV